MSSTSTCSLDALYCALQSDKIGIQTVTQLSSRRKEEFSGQTIVHMAYGNDIENTIAFANGNNAKVIYLCKENHLNEIVEHYDNSIVSTLRFYNPLGMTIGDIVEELKKDDQEAIIAATTENEGVSFVQLATNCGYIRYTYSKYVQLCYSIYGPLVKVKDFIDFLERMDEKTVVDFAAGESFPTKIVSGENVVIIEAITQSELTDKILKSTEFIAASLYLAKMKGK